jgi:hypothetical protein
MGDRDQSEQLIGMDRHAQSSASLPVSARLPTIGGAQAARSFRLPRRLLLKTEGCDGEVNAWYDDGVITVCYEYLDWVWQSAPQQTTPAGTAANDTVVGSVVQIILHEAGHAVFDLLKVPIFGSEEDDADQ